MRYPLIMLICLFYINSISQNTKKSFKIGDQEFDLIYHSENANVDYKTDHPQDGLTAVTIFLSNHSTFSPAELEIEWAIPSDNIAGYWSSRASLSKIITPDWGPAIVRSMLAREAPVMCLFGYDDKNRQTFAVSDALNTVISSAAVKEENGMIYNKVKLFSEKHRDLNSYEVQLRFDTRNIPFSMAISDVADWWASFERYKPAPVPEAAKGPVYSSWYSYHQNVSRKALVEECKLAKSMGFESIIVDDGWQTLDSNRGYAYTGDWNPDRIKDMKQFVEDVHKLDMKFILWYAVPFAGEESEAYDKMKGKFLTYWNGQGAYVMDPRFPEVREFIIDTYIKAVEDWDLDGFKLDFLGRFKAEADTRLVADEGRDFASVNDAMDRLMTDLMASLREVKPDIMIEFRQPYTGPAMRKYGNMFRAADCPNVAMMNRVRTTDLRLLSGNTAVHADMLMWHYTETVEMAALQLLNVLFSVPQISVRLDDIPDSHFKMIRFYTDYWVKNRTVLLEGDFRPENPQLNYPIIKGNTKDKEITVLFEDLVVEVENETYLNFDVVNAKTTKRIIIDFKGDKQLIKYSIYNCTGDLIKQDKKEFQQGIFSFDVPASGLISFDVM